MTVKKDKPVFFKNLIHNAALGVGLLIASMTANATVAVTGGSFSINFDTGVARFYGGYVSPLENGNAVVHGGGPYQGSVYNGQAYADVSDGINLLYAINNKNPANHGLDVNPSTNAIFPVNNNIDNYANLGSREVAKTTLTFDENASDLASLAASMNGEIGTSGLTYLAIPNTAWGSVDGDWKFSSSVNPLNAAAGTWKAMLGIDFVGVATLNLTNIQLTHVGGDGFTLIGDISPTPLAGSFYGAIGATDFGNFNLTVTTVPAPSAIWLFGSTLLGFVGVRRHKSILNRVNSFYPGT